jgi:hypothetical protein
VRLELQLQRALQAELALQVVAPPLVDVLHQAEADLCRVGVPMPMALITRHAPANTSATPWLNVIRAMASATVGQPFDFQHHLNNVLRRQRARKVPGMRCGYRQRCSGRQQGTCRRLLQPQLLQVAWRAQAPVERQKILQFRSFTSLNYPLQQQSVGYL